MNFEILEGITQADAAFRIYGRDLKELFRSGAGALFSVMISNADCVKRAIEKKVELENESIDLLLHDFLQEIIFFKDSESLILFPEAIDIAESGNTYKLKCSFQGEGIDVKKHQLKIDVKAVTFHNLKVEKIRNEWTGTFVLDV
ncbi:MAG: archease [Spirochaetes bacterium]|nr:archease [Spirochaetota bacterium]